LSFSLCQVAVPLLGPFQLTTLGVSLVVAFSYIFSCPCLLIQGDEDEVVSPTAVFAWRASLENPPQLIKINGASHFFHGKLIELRDNLINTFNHSQ
jgi:alpha/beta superfamily hydrolase